MSQLDQCRMKDPKVMPLKLFSGSMKTMYCYKLFTTTIAFCNQAFRIVSIV
jgi:hypothetical protein